MDKLICRACLHTLKTPFLSLGSQPLSNAYLKVEQLGQMEPHYPLDLYVCPRCFLVQLPEMAKAETIFNADYAYFSSFSTSWLEHCKKYADMAAKRFHLNSKSLVLEVASNDGYLLQYFKAMGIKVLGVEPAAATAKAARKKCIPTDICFFNVPYAKKLVKSNKRADLIAGNNVLAHNPNLRDFVHALAIALKPDGVITLEFPYLLNLINSNQFDTIYHEHYSYFSLHPLVRLFKEFKLDIFDVEQLRTHGGSLRIYCCHAADRSKQRSDSVPALLAHEKKAGLLKTATYAGFRQKVEKVKRDLLMFLIKAKAHGKSIAGYGAAAKGNTLLNYCGIRTDMLDYVVDRNRHKQGLYLPGTHIPVLAPDQLKKTRPGYVLILPWNIREEVIKQMSHIKSWNGRFLVAIPRLKIS